MLRFILYIIVTFIIFKVIGVVLQFFRMVMTAFHAGVTPPAKAAGGRPPQQYSNVEDVDYEDITDTK